MKFPTSPNIPVISLQLTAAASIVCSAGELESLKSLEGAFEDALANIVEALEAIQEQLTILNGNTDSAESTTDAVTNTGAATTTGAATATEEPLTTGVPTTTGAASTTKAPTTTIVQIFLVSLFVV